MAFTSANYMALVNLYWETWTERSMSEMIQEAGKGCFVWDYREDQSPNEKHERSGWFRSKDEVAKEFTGVLADCLIQMIDEADHEHEIVVGLVFEDKGIALRLWKTGHEKIVRAITIG